jgi:nucleoside 2-deoxyribosyltransferase
VTLARLQAGVHFSTFAGANQKRVLLGRADNITLHATDVEKTIGFHYFHTLSKPVVDPDRDVRACDREPKVINVEAEKVLRFGMVEGTAKVTAKMATYDPQMPGAPKPFRENGSSADRLAVVANRSEAEQMTGRKNPEAACKAILKTGAEVAIVKCGPDGCLVGTSNGIASVPAYYSRRVWPIGTGDVFSALFANGWMELGMKPAEAADRASKGTSHFVQAGHGPTEEELRGKRFVPLRRLPRNRQKKVYLAGPFFNLSQRWLIEEFKVALQDAGLRVFSPLHDVGSGTAEAVYEPDIKGLKQSGVVLACLDGLDPGTIYEVGYAHSLGLKVIVFVSSERAEDLKMIQGGGSEITDDFATALYFTIWAATCE